MDDLTQWLSAQLDEDDRITLAADHGPWECKNLGRHDQAAVSTSGGPTALIQLGGARAAANGVYVARHDPARALVESAIKRRVVDEYDACAAWAQMPDAAEAFRYRAEAYREVLKNFAELYADRPGYREEWRP